MEVRKFSFLIGMVKVRLFFVLYDNPRLLNSDAFFSSLSLQVLPAFPVKKFVKIGASHLASLGRVFQMYDKTSCGE